MKRTPSCQRSRLVLLVIFLGVVSTTSGCATMQEWWRNGAKVGPNFTSPPPSVAPDWIDKGKTNDTKTAKVSSERADISAWWGVFNDPDLNTIIETASRQNLDVQAAGARIMQARALRNVAVGSLFPQQQESIFQYNRTQNSQNGQFGGFPGFNVFDLWSTGFNLSWELDFWGRYRRGVEAANANLNASIENRNDVMVILLSEVAANYVQFRTFQERIRLAKDNAKIQQELLGLSQKRLEKGATDILDVAQLDSNLNTTLALISRLEYGQRQASNQLCILLGTPPRDLAAELGAAPIPTSPAEVAAGLPIDLLRQRPDLRRAESELVAQNARVGVATADFFPRITIFGSMGYDAKDLADLFTANSFRGSITPNLTWDILNYGRLLNKVRFQDALYQEKALKYQNTVLQAAREVEDSMKAFLQSHDQAARLDKGAKAARLAVDTVIVQSKQQKFDVNRQFTTTNFRVQTEDSLAVARGEVALSLISLYKSLGGGWEIGSETSPSGNPHKLNHRERRGMHAEISLAPALPVTNEPTNNSPLSVEPLENRQVRDVGPRFGSPTSVVRPAQ